MLCTANLRSTLKQQNATKMKNVEQNKFTCKLLLNSDRIFALMGDPQIHN